MMFRNVLTGVVLTAMFSLMLGNTNAEARHCRRQRQHNCCGQNSNYGYNHGGNYQNCNSWHDGSYGTGYGYSHGGYSNAGYGGYRRRSYSSVGFGNGDGCGCSGGGHGFYSGY